MEYNVKYEVRFSDNTGVGDYTAPFGTEEEAEEAIEIGLKECKEYFKDCDYDYADFGNKTEFWIIGGDEYISWERMWL